MVSRARTPVPGSHALPHPGDGESCRGVERIHAHLLPLMQQLSPRADGSTLRTVTLRYVAALDDTGVNLLVTAIEGGEVHDLELIARELLVLAEEEAYLRDRASWIDPLYAKFHECASGTGFGGPLARRALELLSRPFDDFAVALAQARELANEAAAQDPRFVPFAAALAELRPPDA